MLMLISFSSHSLFTLQKIKVFVKRAKLDDTMKFTFLCMNGSRKLAHKYTSVGVVCHCLEQNRLIHNSLRLCVKVKGDDPFKLVADFVSELDPLSTNVLPRFQASVSLVFLLSADNMVSILSHRRLFWLPLIWPAPILSTLAV